MTQPTLDGVKRDIENFAPHDKGCAYREWLDFIISTGAGNGCAVATECNCTRREKIALLEERDRLATVAEFLTEECVQAYGGWNGPAPSPAEFHISWGTQQHSPSFDPIGQLSEQAQLWKVDQIAAAEEAQ